MENDKNVVIPHDVWISRKKGRWSVTCFQNYFDVEIPEELGERLWRLYEEYYKRETWRDRRSFSFKWQRFWYHWKRRNV